MRRSAIFTSFHEWMLLLMYQMTRYTHGEAILRLTWRWIIILADDGARRALHGGRMMNWFGECAHNLSRESRKRQSRVADTKREQRH